jgi:hypothetical protein
MQSFTITWGRYWFSRIAGRNPLVRGDDRHRPPTGVIDERSVAHIVADDIRR